MWKAFVILSACIHVTTLALRLSFGLIMKVGARHECDNIQEKTQGMA
jgi:hypothetical protein